MSDTTEVIEFPKWVVPHESQVVRKEVDGAPSAISTPGFSESHVNRVTGEVTVLVADADEEARATSAAKAPEVVESDPVVEPDPVTEPDPVIPTT